MALSGNFQTTWKGYTYSIDWVGVQNITENITTITCTHKLICGSSWSLRISQRTLNCIVNSLSQQITCAAINTNGGTTITLGTTRYMISHNSNGTASFSLSSTFPLQATISGTYKDSLIVSGNATIDTIPRTSTISYPEFTMGTAGTITINKASDSFTHTIAYTFGNVSENIVVKTADSSVNWTPDTNKLIGQLPNGTRGYGSFVVTTYSGDTVIGTNDFRFYCNIPSSTAPTLGTVTLTPDPVNQQSILIKDKNKLTISVTGSAASAGATIQSYTFSGPNINTTTTSNSVTFGPISSEGTLTYTVTITDTRGASKSGTYTIDCHTYTPPKFKQFKAYRDSQNNIKCDYQVYYDALSDSNGVVVSLYYKQGNGNYQKLTTDLTDASRSGFVVVSNAVDSTYAVYAKVVDSYGMSASSNAQTILSSSRIINISSDGTGIGIGKKAESSDLVDIVQQVKSRSGFVLELDKIGKECVIFGAYNLMTYDLGQSGTFTMGKNASEFGYIEIYYGDSTNKTYCSTRIHNPNSKYAMLMCPKNDGTVKFSKWQIQGNQMIPDASINNTDIRIYKVLGYIS